MVMEKAEWKVTGMHCGSCGDLIKDILADHQAKDVSLSFQSGKLVFTAPPGELAGIQKEIEKEGYGVAAWK